MSVDLTVIGQNLTNIRVFNNIKNALKLEPVLTDKLVIRDLKTAFERIEYYGRFVTTVICNPVCINYFEKLNKTNFHIYESIDYPSSLTEEEIINNPLLGLVGHMWTTNVRVCNLIKRNIIWTCARIPEDDFISSLTEKDLKELERMAENLLKNLSIPFGFAPEDIKQRIKEDFKDREIDDNVLIACPIIIS